MPSLNQLALLLLGWLLHLQLVTSVPYRHLYPFGVEKGDTEMDRGDDISTNEIRLQTSIAFYNNYYRSIYVNLNGHLSFDTEVPDYRGTLILPIGFKVIAAFLADIDTSASGAVYYRETTDLALLQRAARDIQKHFSGHSTYQPTSLFVVTWDRVGYWRSKRDKVNTFQIVLATNGRDSFAFFHYLDDGVQWTMADGKTAPALADSPAQAGFDSGERSRYYVLKGSGKTVEFTRLSNVNASGVWMFHIGNVGDRNIILPEPIYTGDVTIFEVGTESSCFQGAGCHADAVCRDFETGTCCQCQEPMYGNGVNCLEPSAPQRLNGKVRGTVNGVRLDDLDQHTYVVTSDGRAYSAISRVPPTLGYAMQTLNTIGGIIGWLFALPSGPRARNGYMITGGEFNRTAEVVFTINNTTRTLMISQRFFGHDALNNLRMETTMNGEVPDIYAGSKVTVDDFKENYRRVAPGVITAYSSRTYRVDDVAFRYTWNQSISYSECPHDPQQVVADVMRLSVMRNFVVYDDKDQVARYAMSNKVAVFAGEDPCRDAAQVCDAYADCISLDNTYRCRCRPGFRGNGEVCEDIDECVDRSPCDVNARCFNVPGSFQCQCEPGFKGDGRKGHCTRITPLCGDDVCDDNARCVYNNDLQRAICECNSGFAGNGLVCNIVEFSCNEVDICGDNAQCVYDPQDARYVCECMDGFSGDGYQCESPIANQDCRRCDPNAECPYDVDRMVFRCQCREGYTGDGFTCSRIDLCAECDVNAECKFEPTVQEYRCACKSGYYGDGYRCEVYDCRVQAVCDSNAQCVQDPVLASHVCRCNPGYTGDGRRCELLMCRADSDCGQDARCILDPRDQRRTLCQCREGFRGDGQTCVQTVVPCNQVNNCDPAAECVYDPDALSYRCRCRPGYEGDGTTCVRRDTYDCRRDPRLCDPNASCLETQDAYRCVCNRNFRGDGRTCQAAASEGSYLIYAQGYTLTRLPYAGSSAQPALPIVYLPTQQAVGVDTDCRDGHVYWTDVMGGHIRRARLDGTNIESVLSGLRSPEGVAVDYVSRNLYFTDSELDVVGVARLDGTHKATLISRDLVNPRAIVVDPSRGVFYFTDWNRGQPRVEKANMDGSERTVIVSSDLGLPNGLALDTFTQQLCWGDAGTHRLECVRADGRGRRIINDQASYPFDLAFFNGVLYWTDWERKDIPNMNRDALQTNEPLALGVGGYGKTFGITAVLEQCPRVNNACALNNGGCRYLCLPTPNGGRTCACPDDVDPRRCPDVAVLNRQ